MNSMPAASSADLMSTKLDVRLGGSPSNASYLFIVRPLTPAFLGQLLNRPSDGGSR